MKISFNWLKEYINIDLSPAKIAELLTNCGLEVESVEYFQTIKGGLKGVVVGEVRSVKKHPDADNLFLTEVEIGNGVVLPIVCGAPNVLEGQKVAIATVGTILFLSDRELEIKSTKIRGEISEGMICAEDELGLGANHEGIMVLDPEAIPGQPASEYFKIQNDVVFEIGLTPNRSDATSHYGVARDLAAVLNNLVNDPEVSGKYNIKAELPSIAAFKQDNSISQIEVIIEDTDACPRYCGLTITGISVKESPAWMQNYLKASGLRPINSLVDISNFVLLETGQPLHFFDADQITGGKVIIKKLPKGTRFKTLDEVERELTGDDLMICNTREGMCIAGVFGGIDSGVTENTKNLFVESAYFEPLTIRRTSKHHDLHTDASFRFERGADPDMAVYAIKRAALLIKEIAGGSISSPILDVYPHPLERKKVSVKYEHVNKLAGITIPGEKIKKILLDLGIDITQEDQYGLNILVPAFKADVSREADVIEEILRIYGYNNVELQERSNVSFAYTEKPDKEKIQHMVSDYLSDTGFSEIVSNSLTNSKYTEANAFIDKEKNVRLLNPVSTDLDIMRQTLLFGGLEAIRHNIYRKTNNLKLYEFGNTYYFLKENDSSDNRLNNYQEELHFALFLTGDKQKENWYMKSSVVDIYYLKSTINNILQKIGCRMDAIRENTIADEIFSEGLAYVYCNERIVIFGELRETVTRQFDIKQPVFYADLRWDIILHLIKDHGMDFQVLPKYPEVRRDLALLLDKKVQWTEIKKIAFQTESKLLKRINLFDIYEGERIDLRKKSYAISFHLQSDDHTLTDAEIDKVMIKLMNAFKTDLKAEIRS